MAKKSVWLIVGLLATLISFIVGVTIGVFVLHDFLASSSLFSSLRLGSSSNRFSDHCGDEESGVEDRRETNWTTAMPDESFSDARIFEEISAQNIERHMTFLSERPHLAGTAGDQRTVDYLKTHFEQLGYDVTLVPYDVVLSYPADKHFNKVSMLDGRGRPLFQSSPGAKSGPQSDPEVTWPYCLYAPSGSVTGKLIYANYGRPKDFRILKEMEISVWDTVVIMRYGKNSRSEKVREAVLHGAKAVILYNDPADVNVNLTYNVFPASWWLPGNDVEHGSVRIGRGDPSTPGYPATGDAYRLAEKDMDLPTIPCHPVGYDDARILLQNLEGAKAPDDWQGKLGFIYHIGTETSDGLPVEVDVENVLVTRRVYNIIATMNGTTEPDRWVLVGNHRDAVVYGALDPVSGTAAMLEIAEVFAARQAKQGWKPRRSLMFCSWAAKEFGLIGSTEWVEGKQKWLMDHAIAYLNIDTALQGNYTFDMSATPSLKAVGMRAAAKVPDPHGSNRTVFDVWRERVVDEKSPGQPWVRRPVTITDTHPFVHLAAVPVTVSTYSFLGKDGMIIYPFRSYPLYLTEYDSMQLARMLDPSFAISKAVTAVTAEMVLELVDSPVIPLSPRDYALDIVNHLRASLDESRAKLNVSTGNLQSASEDFLQAAELIQNEVDNLNTSNPLDIRRLNDKLMQFEKEFLDRTNTQHLILMHGSNTKPDLNEKEMAALSQALRAAASALTS